MYKSTGLKNEKRQKSIANVFQKPLRYSAKLISTFICTALATSQAIGTDGIGIIPTMTSDFGSVVVGSDAVLTRSTITRVILHLQCYRTNLRSVPNPLNPSSDVTAKITLMGTAGDVDLEFNFPAQASALSALQTMAAADITLTPLGATPSGATIKMRGNLIVASLPGVALAPIGPDGTIDIDKRSALVKGYSFNQTIPPSAPLTGTIADRYRGRDGLLTVQVNHKVAGDSRLIAIDASFPGSNGFCGGFFSPLMMFFDDARPSFTGQSAFPLSPIMNTVWPEKNAPGYFLVRDKNKDHKITTADELFGAVEEKFENGFAALVELDSNHDGFIDAKDKEFASLMLWQDKNGDGISQADELSTLADHKVQSIQLNYRQEMQDFGARARYKEVSDFQFLDGNDKPQKGSIIDMWFAPLVKPENMPKNQKPPHAKNTATKSAKKK